MSFLPLAAIVVAFWFCVHLRSHYVSRQATILPLTTAIRPSNILYIHEGFTVERSSLFVQDGPVGYLSRANVEQRALNGKDSGNSFMIWVH